VVVGILMASGRRFRRLAGSRGGPGRRAALRREILAAEYQRLDVPRQWLEKTVTCWMA
jgi:hypothetical protein